MKNLLQLYQEYTTYLYPGNPVTRWVLRVSIKDRVDRDECWVVYKYLGIVYED